MNERGLKIHMKNPPLGNTLFYTAGNFSFELHDLSKTPPSYLKSVK